MGASDELRIRVRFDTRDTQRDLQQTENQVEQIGQKTERAAEKAEGKLGGIGNLVKRGALGLLSAAASVATAAAPGQAGRVAAAAPTFARDLSRDVVGFISGTSGEAVAEADRSAEAETQAFQELAQFAQQTAEAGFEPLSDEDLAQAARNRRRVLERGLRQRDRVQTMLSNRVFDNITSSWGDLASNLNPF